MRNKRISLVVILMCAIAGFFVAMFLDDILKLKGGYWMLGTAVLLFFIFLSKFFDWVNDNETKN